MYNCNNTIKVNKKNSCIINIDGKKYYRKDRKFIPMLCDKCNIKEKN